jgi:hypothetical protein
MLQKIKQRLEAWGYTATSDEDDMLQFLIDKTEAHIRNFCNIPEVPEELEEAEVDMIAIEYLKERAAAGELDDAKLSICGVSSITEGDVTTSFSASGASVTLPELYNSASRKFDAELMPFRRLRW